MSCPVMLVVPCYNEAARLRPADFTTFLAAHPEMRLLFVDDGSGDGTMQVLNSIQREVPDQVEVLSLSRNMGKGAAIRAGVLHCRDRKVCYVGYWDADLAAPLEQVMNLLTALETHPSAVAALGVRVPGAGRHIERTRLRRLLGIVYAGSASWVLRERLIDPQCGAKLFRAVPEVEAVFGDPFTARWAFDTELLLRLKTSAPLLDGGRVVEVSLGEWREMAGSRLRPLPRIRAAAELIRLAVSRLRRVR